MIRIINRATLKVKNSTKHYWRIQSNQTAVDTTKIKGLELR